MILGGFGIGALGGWLLIGTRDPLGLAAVLIGVFMVAYGIDVIGHPSERRALSPKDLGDFILRLWAGIGPS